MNTLDGKPEISSDSDDSILMVQKEAGVKSNIFIRKNLENEFIGIPAGIVKIIRILDERSNKSRTNYKCLIKGCNVTF